MAIKEIAYYWTTAYHEDGVYIDWDETGVDPQDATERCWRCGSHKGKRLQRCHMIPESCDGENHPKNLILLCHKCHKEAPNFADRNAMLNWLYNSTRGDLFRGVYDSYWFNRALDAYEKLYGKNFINDLVQLFSEAQERSVKEDKLFEDLKKYLNEGICKSSFHFGSGGLNSNTQAAVFKYALDRCYEVWLKNS